MSSNILQETQNLSASKLIDSDVEMTPEKITESSSSLKPTHENRPRLRRRGQLNTYNVEKNKSTDANNCEENEGNKSIEEKTTLSRLAAEDVDVSQDIAETPPVMRYLRSLPDDVTIGSSNDENESTKKVTRRVLVPRRRRLKNESFKESELMNESSKTNGVNCDVNFESHEDKTEDATTSEISIVTNDEDNTVGSLNSTESTGIESSNVIDLKEVPSDLHHSRRKCPSLFRRRLGTRMTSKLSRGFVGSYNEKQKSADNVLNTSGTEPETDGESESTELTDRLPDVILTEGICSDSNRHSPSESGIGSEETDLCSNATLTEINSVLEEDMEVDGTFSTEIDDDAPLNSLDDGLGKDTTIAREKSSKSKKMLKTRESVDQLKMALEDAGTERADKPSEISHVEECPWSVGDVVWAKLMRSPFWPSVVIENPFSNDGHFMRRKWGSRQLPFVYVQFLNYRGTHAWTSMQYTLPFNGVDAFKDLDPSQWSHLPKKDKFHNDVDQLKLTKRWLGAVSEGEDLLNKSAAERLEILTQARASKNRKRSTREKLDNSPKAKRRKVRSKKSKEAIKLEKESTSPSKVNQTDDADIEPSGSFKPKKSSASKAKNKTDRKSGKGVKDVKEAKSKNLNKFDVKRAVKFLFKGFADGEICAICLSAKPETLLCCTGQCSEYFHPSCVRSRSNGNRIDFTPNWMCQNCLLGNSPCFICKEVSGDIKKCGIDKCQKFYHTTCFKLFPQGKLKGIKSDSVEGNFTYEISVCPHHMCHTCCSENVTDSQMSASKLVYCVLCPTSYHISDLCLPAGCKIISSKFIKCGKHFDRKNSRKLCHSNASFCSVCCEGGSLFCCDLCPLSFHEKCLQIKPPEDGYICEECESGRFPLHGELVWAKCGANRWWPAKVSYPQEIPSRVMDAHHFEHEFAIEFFGTKNFQWTNRGLIFLYQEGDNDLKQEKGSFRRALVEAAEAYKKRDEMLANTVPQNPPPQYCKTRKNIYLCNTGKSVEAISEDRGTASCGCDKKLGDNCGIDSDCINRALLCECNSSNCKAGETLCQNRRFRKRLYPSLSIFRTRDRGWGLMSKEDIHCGQFIIEYVGEVIDEKEFKDRMERKMDSKDRNFYFLTIDHRIIDAEHRGNLARFMNHSCSPNCETQKWIVGGERKIGLFALSDIPAGTELTFNYNLDCGSNGNTACLCGAPDCKGLIDSKTSRASMKKGRPSAAINPKSSLVKTTQDKCFKCSKGDELLACPEKNCSLAYHSKCVEVNDRPDGSDSCSTHFCSICQKRTGRRCEVCFVAYCASHTEGNIYFSEKGHLHCKQHVRKTEKAARRSSYIDKRNSLQSSQREELEENSEPHLDCS